MLNRPWLRTLALGITIMVLASLLWRSDESRNLDSSGLRGASEPDGFVTDGRFLSFDASGNRTALIESPRVEQFESLDLAVMTSPTATLYDKNSGQPWHLTAQAGELHQGQDLMNLSGNVQVVRPLTGGRQATLTSEQLTLDNRKRTVFTDSPVVIRDDHGVTSAVGMKAWIDDRILELTSQVEGHYDPPEAKHD